MKRYGMKQTIKCRPLGNSKEPLRSEFKNKTEKEIESIERSTYEELQTSFNRFVKWMNERAVKYVKTKMSRTKARFSSSNSWATMTFCLSQICFRPNFSLPHSPPSCLYSRLNSCVPLVASCKAEQR